MATKKKPQKRKPDSTLTVPSESPADWCLPEEGKRGVGRPSLFQEWMRPVAVKMCRMGATDADLAEAFGVTEQTINNWKDSHPEFFESIVDAKAEYDDRVEIALAERALGYSHEAVKILVVDKAVQEVPYIERYPPDTPAAKFWLINRRPKQWREKTTTELDVSDDLAALVVATGKKPVPDL